MLQFKGQLGTQKLAAATRRLRSGLIGLLAFGWVVDAHAQSGGSQAASEIILECQSLDQALSSRSNLDLPSASRLAERALRDRPKCGYVFAGFLRRKGLLNSPDGQQAADQALNETANYLLPQNDGYEYYLKEAIRTGMALPAGRWNASVKSNLVALRNIAADYQSFEAEIFRACNQFSGNPFDTAANCAEQDAMPADLRNKISRARVAREQVEGACALGNPPYRSDQVARCRSAVKEASYRYSGVSFARFNEIIRVADEEIALEDTVAACNFQPVAEAQALVDRAHDCATKLRGKDQNKPAISRSVSALVKQLQHLEGVLRPQGSVVAVAEICRLRSRLEAHAALYNVPFDAMCPNIPADAINLEKAVQSAYDHASQRLSPKIPNLPEFAEKFDDDCLRPLHDFRALQESERTSKLGRPELPAGKYIDGCSRVLRGMLDRLAKIRIGDVMGSAPQQPPLAQAVAAPGAKFLNHTDLLVAWRSIENDRAHLQWSVWAVEQEARLVVEIVNHRVSSIESHLQERCSPNVPKNDVGQHFAWAGRSATLKTALTYLEKWLDDRQGSLSRLLEPRRRAEAVATLAELKRAGEVRCESVAASPAAPVAVAQPSSTVQPGAATIRSAASATQPVAPPAQQARPVAPGATPGPQVIAGQYPPSPAAQHREGDRRTQPSHVDQERPIGGEIDHDRLGPYGARGTARHPCDRPPLREECIDHIRNSLRPGHRDVDRNLSLRLTAQHLIVPADLDNELKDDIVRKANRLLEVGVVCDRLRPDEADRISRDLQRMSDLFEPFAREIMFKRSRYFADCSRHVYGRP